MKAMPDFGQCSNFYLLKTDGVKVNDTLSRQSFSLEREGKVVSVPG
ncbi:hypothetical protein HOLDEFILI_03778 [Holdemania filiformis DSM 12042]|uniref:Uncharacterized protein n=1 Tax=Holdemania filiformis DSM 12042 TaxID=545696 RepID=B9YD62_9FIRM|nr:hypothetical protein HOLDEFILI_03778 [Holdemania filiformis DSM 12042]